MKTMVLLLCLISSLSACVPMSYVKTGASSAEFEQDKQACIYDAQLHVNNDPMMWPMLVSQCLRVKGWSPGR